MKQLKETTMKKLILLLTIICSLQMTMNAQSDYKSAIGVRIGGYYDLYAASYKFFISDPGAIELNLGIKPFNTNLLLVKYNLTIFSLSGAYQHHFPIASVEGLQWYAGAGATAYSSISNIEAYKGFGFVPFITGGADYKFAKIPLNLSADFRPGINIGGIDFYKSFYFTGGIAARYTLN